MEVVHWWGCVLPDGVAPASQDGEVAAFRCMGRAELLARLERDEFTLDAALILLAAYAGASVSAGVDLSYSAMATAPSARAPGRP